MLDTAYLLPVAGIKVKAIQSDTMKQARLLGHQLFVSEISFFELAAKGARLAKDGLVDRGRLEEAVLSLLSDASLKKVGVYEEGPLSLAIDLRRHHSDFVDCLILASAMSACEILVTEDDVLASNDGLAEYVERTRPGFLITSSKRLLAARAV
ncbi:MAG: PIN domain-containing protein [Nitrososphaerota archaeon]|nr:PIN domain-containing protein [Nitrososphaerota archaeon]MDG6966706.1 PIN domain-containing protein [Nitrososphaerota archaeon]MDG6979285.1 PIN domain-containing protein [Nitrososphaerota archaeon]MDG7006166.1 PIN domain-containing protein [Nitrososphaerota archaeon]